MTNYVPRKVGVVRVTWPKFKIWDPTITSERMKLLASGFVLSGEKFTHKGRGLGHVTYFDEING